MPSFSKMGVFPVGYFRAAAEWLLRERRDVVARIDTLQAEIIRIGEVQVEYRDIPEGEGNKKSEQRIGFSVTQGSSIARLVQAYIALGGNPYNISGFLYPNSTEWVDTGSDVVRQERYPGGGFVAPKSASPSSPPPTPMDDGTLTTDADSRTGFESNQAGMIESSRYAPKRMFGRLSRGTWDYSTVNRVMTDVRGWANKEIKTKLQDIEWRIVKLADLAEQLTDERDNVLMAAWGGQLNSLPTLDESQFDPRRLCQVVIQDMYTMLYMTKDKGPPYAFRANVETGYLRFTFPDMPEDEAAALG